MGEGEREKMALRWCAPVGLVALVCAAVPVQRAGEGIVGRAIVQTITPVVDGNLFSDNATRYEDPYQTKCGAEEINITIVGVKGAMCSPVCGALDSCPPIQADSNVTAKARCALQDMAGRKFCALICAPVDDESRPGNTEMPCPEKASCKPIAQAGICTFDE